MFQDAVQYPTPVAGPVLGQDGDPAALTWVVVSDGCRARVYETRGRATGIAPAFDCDFYLSCPDLGSEPGERTFDPRALGRLSRPGQAKGDFARALGRALGKGLAEGRYGRLVLVVPTQCQADLMAGLPAAVSARLSSVVHRDLWHAAPCDLPAILGSALPD